MNHKIDATNQPLGRLASKIAFILIGKNNPTYKPNAMPEEIVTVENIKALKFTGKKADQKIYYHYSGFPGGMKARVLNKVFDKNPKRVLWMAVFNMLPVNRLRSRIIKNLEIK